MDKLKTRTSTLGWCSHLASSFVKLMAGLSILVALGGRPKFWMLCTILKYVFLAFLDDPTIVFPPMITLVSLSGALFVQLINWVWGPLAGFHHPWQIVVTSPTWWGLRSVAWGHSTQRCHAYGLDGSNNICSGAFCLDRPSAYLAGLTLCCPLSI